MSNTNLSFCPKYQIDNVLRLFTGELQTTHANSFVTEIWVATSDPADFRWEATVSDFGYLNANINYECGIDTQPTNSIWEFQTRIGVPINI